MLSVGALFYCAGLVLMAYSTTPGMLNLSAGVLTGLGIAGTSFTLVLAAFSKLMPARMARLRFWRRAQPPVHSASSCFRRWRWGSSTFMGWQQALITLGIFTLLMIPCAFGVRTLPMDLRRTPGGVQKQSLVQALSEAFGHRSYVLLVIGFFTCGFQLLFITVHLPSYLVDRGLSVDAGAWTIGVIGLFNIFGSIAAGWLGDKMPKRYLLSVIYLLRSLAVAVFISLPVTSVSAVVFGASMGLLWLSTVPPTSGLVALMFGTRWMATLFGFAFFSHQVGGFLGVWLGGVLFERTGSYEVIWWLSIALGIISAVINLPIVEKPVVRAEPVPA